MVMRKSIFVCLVALPFLSVSALKCYVGQDAVTTETAMDSSESPFRVEECGSSASTLSGLDSVVAETKAKIDEGLRRLKDTANTLLSNDKSMRRKRAANEDYACLNIKLGKQAYKSCVSKVLDMNLNCTNAENVASLCYCDQDLCNKAGHKEFVGALIIALALTMLV